MNLERGGVCGPLGGTEGCQPWRHSPGDGLQPAAASQSDATVHAGSLGQVIPIHIGHHDDACLHVAGAEASLSAYDFISGCGAESGGPGFRHVLVQGTSGPVRFYHLNAERSMGAANTEVRGSSGVRIYGHKTEGNMVAVWVRGSSDVLLTGYGGNAAAFPNTSSLPPPYPQGLTPVLFRVQDTSEFRFYNLVDLGRVQGGVPGQGAGEGVDPSSWNLALYPIGRNGTGATGRLTPVLARPVVMGQGSWAVDLQGPGGS